MTDTADARKARGAFFTPPAITRFLTEWAIRAQSDRILEPSCGEAEFLLAAGSRLRELGATESTESQLFGFEVHEPSAQIAGSRLRAKGLEANIVISDFFDVRSDRAFDAVVGNPPYIRYQDFAGPQRTKALQAALRGGVRLNGLASSWAAFVVQSASLLHDDGRLALVLPAELLTVKYAAAVRRYLLDRFAVVRLVVFEELVFPGVQEEVVLLMAEGRGAASHIEMYQVRDLDELASPASVQWISCAPYADKWLPTVIDSEARLAYQRLSLDDRFEFLLDWGDTYLGTVTGNNRFFTLDAEAAFRLRIPKEELLKISPPGSKHLRVLEFSHESWGRLLGDGRACYLLIPDLDSPSRDALEYIWAGEKVALHRSYKCRMRSPWWRVPTVDVPDLFMTYMDRDRPRIVANTAGAYHLNSLYGIKLRVPRREIGADLLPLAAVNSVTVLSAELVGRSYGGGILKLEPREADRLVVPSLSAIEVNRKRLSAIKSTVSGLLAQGALEKAIDLVDGVLLPDPTLRMDLAAIRRARLRLFGRRVARSKTNGSR